MSSTESESMSTSAVSTITVAPMDTNISDIKLNDANSLPIMTSETPYGKQRVPPEVIILIIEFMIDDKDTKYDKPTIICLGLTAHIYWDFLKSKYPMQKLSPTSSCFQSCLCPPSAHRRWGFLNIDDKKRLGTLLKTWAGPDYRPVSDAFLNYSRSIACQIMFLRRDVYGEVSDDGCMRSHEKALMERLVLWKEFPLRDWPRNIAFRSPMLKTLSNPYGMGMDWYPTAAKEVRGMMCHWKGMDGVGFQDSWDAAQFSFWYAYDQSCLWHWVAKKDAKDVPEIKRLKKELRDFEKRVWKPILRHLFQLDDVTETDMSDEDELEATLGDAAQREATFMIAPRQIASVFRVLLGSLLILSGLFLAFC
ncbi:hypothetical protein EYC84_002101 [Monilinia fructicola]|uniref:Uncharacterized protein n=1 Tax=Monilinia fructicola TaxID=38448 RepID=A0A5M9JWM5_MONFR|nr:hypothetical protein EYC84_002101 [Monilinia fructicola]